MKRDDEKLKPLLDDLLAEDDTPGGPGLPAVLGMAAQQRVRRSKRQRGAAVACLAVIGILFGIWFTQSRPQEITPPFSAVEPEAVEKGFSQINDTELVNLIDGAPMAFLEWPDGSRTLLVVEY